MYNHIDAGQMPDLELHNVTTRLAIMYERTLEYSKYQLSAKRDCLYITNSQNLKTMANQGLAYEEALNGFLRQRWLNYGLVNIKFPFH